jgi:uncharacterized membrane protein YidH (DUF202 family)
MNGDSGLQSERTLLAWRRTALGLLANAVLLIATGFNSSPVRFALGIVVAVIALAGWATVGAAYRRHLNRPQLADDALLRTSVAVVLLVGVFDLYAVITR